MQPITGSISLLNMYQASSIQRQMQFQEIIFFLSGPQCTSGSHSSSGTGSSGCEETRLGLQRLDQGISRLFDQGISESTRATYQSGWRQYIKFCEKFHLPTLPLTEHTLCQFLRFLSNSVCWGTIRSYLSALRFWQIRAGFHDPSLSSFPRLEYVLKGTRRNKSKSPRNKRLPITPELLRWMHGVWSQPPLTFNRIMLWAACCTGFFGFMRAGEFTYPTASDHMILVSDISVDSLHSPQVITIKLRQSKTDQFGAGVCIYLGRTRDTLCPVTALLGYLAIRPPKPGPLFIFQDGSPLSRPKLIVHVREALAKAGIDTRLYSGHSFRIGAASAAARAGFSDSFIQTLGRWKSSSFMTYIRTPVNQLIAVASKLVRPEVNSTTTCNDIHITKSILLE